MRLDRTIGLLVLVLGLGSLTLFASTAGARSPGTTVCTGDLTASVQGNLDVPAGATCNNFGPPFSGHAFDVYGDTSVEGSLNSLNAEYHGNVTANGGTVNFPICFSLICGGGGNRIDGYLSVVNSPGQNHYTGTVLGSISFRNGSGSVDLEQVSANSIAFTHNANVSLFDLITNTLLCAGNNPGPIFNRSGSNIGKYAGDQCRPPV